MSEPSLALYHRGTIANRAAMLLAATRPAFLSASVLPVLSAAALAWYLHQGPFSFALVLAAVINIALIHLGANALNDYYDARNGTDAANTARIFPFTGGSRFIQNGVMSAEEVRALGMTLLALGALMGLGLSALTGWPLLLIGLVGGVCAVLYSMPGGLAPRGLGDLTIALCFGILPSIGVAFMLLGHIPAAAWWLGLATGSFTAAILWVNSIPDMAADRSAGKLTLPARLGAMTARHGLLVLFALGGLALVAGPFPWQARTALVALLPAAAAVRALEQGRLLPAIPLTLLAHASLCVVLALGLVLARGMP